MSDAGFQSIKSLYELRSKQPETANADFSEAMSLVRALREFIDDVEPQDPCGWELLEMLKKKADVLIVRIDKQTAEVMARIGT